MKENPLFKKKKRKQKTLDLISHVSLQTVTAITEKKKDQILEERVRETWRDSYIPLLRIPRRVATPIQTRRMGIFTLSHHSILIQPSSLFFHCFLFEFCEPRREREISASETQQTKYLNRLNNKKTHTQTHTYMLKPEQYEMKY